jgi:hypothetical protein
VIEEMMQAVEKIISTYTYLIHQNNWFFLFKTLKGGLKAG